MSARSIPFARLRLRFAAVVLVAVIPGFVLAFYAAADEERTARENAAAATLAVAEAASDDYKSLMRETRTLLNALSSVATVNFENPACLSVLDEVVSDSEIYENIVIARADGTIVCYGRPDPEPVDPEAEPYATALATGEFAIGDYQPGDTETPPHLVTAVATEDAFGGYLIAAQLSLERVAALVASISLPENLSLLALSDDNQVLLTQGDAGAAIGDDLTGTDVATDARAAETGTMTADGPDGIRRIYGFAHFEPPPGSVVLAGLPSEVAYSDAASQFRTRIIALSVAALIALAVAMTVSYAAIIRRLRSLVRMARRIGTGDLAARSNVRTMDEIGELGRALDAMAEDLRHRDEERARLLTAVVEASEDERRRIAHDVHDDPIQVMSAHVMRLQLLRRQVEDPEVKAQIVELEESGRAATARLRNLVFELHSPILDEHGLEAALEALLERTFDGVGVDYVVESTLASEPPDATRDTAYRIAQEAIRNTRRHAGAQVVRVELRRDVDDLVVRVVDDGGGFTPDALEDRPGHLGLRAARERASAVGGGVAVSSSPGRGTTVVCRLPWTLEPAGSAAGTTSSE